MHWFDGDIRAQAVVDGRTQKPLNCVWASGQGFTQTRPLPVGASQPVVDVNPVARHPECDKAIALGSQVLLIGGASAYPMSSAVMAHLLQLGRPDATPRPPATAKAAPLTTRLSQGSQQDRLSHTDGTGGAVPVVLVRRTPGGCAECRR